MSISRKKEWRTEASLVFALVFLVALFFCFGTLRDYWQQPLQSLPEERFYLVEEGASLNFVVDDLAAQGLWATPRLIRICLWSFSPQFLLKAGEYRFPGASSPAEIFAILGSGIPLQHKVTLREGETLQQWWRQLASTATLQSSLYSLPKFQAEVAAEPGASEERVVEMDAAALSQLLSPLAQEMMVGQVLVPLEGWFFPDTYYYSRGDSVDDILRRAHLRMLQMLQYAWSERVDNLPYRSPYQALIMASLIEKETGLSRERREIAGVFVRRLEKKMRLQTDPSVIYGLGRDYTGDLRRADLRSESPYNTYRWHGLPPTPIAMPGRASIVAALQPAAGDALYFVARGDGSHHFSASWAEHRRAVQHYQLRERRSDYRSRP